MVAQEGMAGSAASGGSLLAGDLQSAGLEQLQHAPRVDRRVYPLVRSISLILDLRCLQNFRKLLERAPVGASPRVRYHPMQESERSRLQLEAWRSEGFGEGCSANDMDNDARDYRGRAGGARITA
jgi:hypothetical protein